MTEKRERWNKAELAILKEHYPNMPRYDLMQLLPRRTWRATCSIAGKQKVHRNERLIPMSEDQMAMLHAKFRTIKDRERLEETEKQ